MRTMKNNENKWMRSKLANTSSERNLWKYKLLLLHNKLYSIPLYNLKLGTVTLLRIFNCEIYECNCKILTPLYGWNNNIERAFELSNYNDEIKIEIKWAKQMLNKRHSEYILLFIQIQKWEVMLLTGAMGNHLRMMFIQYTSIYRMHILEPNTKLSNKCVKLRVVKDTRT